MQSTQTDEDQLITAGEIAGEQIFVHSPNSILEDNDQVELILLRENMRRSYLRIGEIANKYIVGNALNGGFTAEKIYQDVGRLVGKKPRTVRYYADVQAFYADKDIHEFEILPFSFFNYAKSFGDDGCYQVLYLALLTPYMTLNELESIAIHNGSDIDDKTLRTSPDAFSSTSFSSFRDFRENSSLDRSDDNAPAPYNKGETPRIMSRHGITMLVTTVSDLVERLGRLSDRVEMPDEVIERVDRCLSELRAVLPLIARLIKNRDTMDEN